MALILPIVNNFYLKQKPIFSYYIMSSVYAQLSNYLTIRQLVPWARQMSRAPYPPHQNCIIY